MIHHGRRPPQHSSKKSGRQPIQVCLKMFQSMDTDIGSDIPHFTQLFNPLERVRHGT